MKDHTDKFMLGYLAAGLLAFGHSASAPEIDCPGWRETSSCRVLNGMAAGVVWPAYVSWVAFDAVREAD